MNAICAGRDATEKRWKSTAVQDAGACSSGLRPARSVLECARPLALSPARHGNQQMSSLPAIWIVLGATAFSKPELLQNPRPNYSEFPNSLKILESPMNWAITENGLRIYLTGVLTNTGPVSWNDVKFDCRFFDSHGVMLDADARQGYVTILPHDDTAFRVAIIPTAPTNAYSSFKIFVGSASNASSWF